ncbi:ricin B lectin domain-containing protein [Achaetomium macrosporum]|uniref:Ricin B lectin domain-containing protein n=1 Tax=Achaetomium macrosporum TaxID=79813 RepID=A0AAN7C4C7_9PEZI|nr:ricin B lectin domain-containing protein [Achaetomium macrosporum]
MLRTSVLLLTLAATGLAQAPAPEGYRKVYITSNVNPKFVIVPKAATSGSTVVVKTLNNKPEQQWYIKDNTTKIQLVDSTLCLDGGAQSNWRDMGNIYVNTCAENAASQNWLVMGDGRIALEPTNKKQCIDLQYMRATENNPVGLYNCAGLGNTGAADKGINWPLVNVTA